MIPTLRTERLILRALRDSDAQPWAELTRDPGVHRNVGTFPAFFTPLHAEARIDRVRAAQAVGRISNFAVEYQGKFIGTFGVVRSKERAVIGYGYARSVWGMGIATEVAQTVLAWADEDFAPAAYVAGYYIDNPVSGRVLTKLGFVTDGEPEPHFCMGRMEYALSQSVILPRANRPITQNLQNAHAA